MNPRFLLLVGLSLSVLGVPLRPADPPPSPAQQAEITRLRGLLQSLQPQQGEIALPGGIAQLSLPPDYRYLDSKDTSVVMTDLWHNPRVPHLGLIYKDGPHPFGGKGWVALVDYTEDGHIKDDDAASIDYPKLLSEMKDAAVKEDEERSKQGYPTYELIGWAEPPHYDAGSRKLYWAKDLKFSGQGERADTLNYNIRILGRKGVLNLNVIAKMTDLPQVRQAAPALLGMVNFKPGNRYADFDSSTDKVAAYGVAALVAGGIAAKAGLFKVLITALLAAKKFVIIWAAAIVAWFKKTFGRKKDASSLVTPSSNS
jgi:uncharacterized membrane-anchored protein